MCAGKLAACIKLRENTKRGEDRKGTEASDVPTHILRWNRSRRSEDKMKEK